MATGEDASVELAGDLAAETYDVVARAKEAAQGWHGEQRRLTGAAGHQLFDSWYADWAHRFEHLG
jgi:hypothetical protein